ncbi:hypothetical protein SASPL_122580 [Salvia splendens]|uniref:Uncharacterized protein n=1 Tax=Salvia splendens TaxID=180675 RepID=A0A8X8XJJ3_SALSN|nr:uncharacterized protein At2g27730, mitochondrial-like isoform X1 [Salvia splendens]KAG6415176.1 hypothetical protein SASPL_122580 [Salvia splendens]
MATRMAARHISRRLSSSGKVLSEEEKAAENIYIKKMEQEKLEKLAQKGPASGTVADAKPSSGSGTSETPNVSTDKHRNYGVVVGIGTALAAFGWYMGSKKKRVEVQD